jgi:hypothetical protein
MNKIKAYNEMLKTADPSTTPRATMKETSYDFGMVDPHTTLSHEFEISNSGEIPLKLDVAGTSCKCTVGELANDLLPPGGMTIITMTWNTGYQAEHYEQSATIITNDPLAESIELKVEGEVRAEFVVPEQIAFDKADFGQQTEAKLIVYSQLWDDFSVQDIGSDLEGFEWHAEPISTSDPRLSDREARSAWLIRLFVTSLEYGNFHGKVAITARPADGGDEVVRELECQGKVRAPINFYSKDIHSSRGLDIGTLAAGKKHLFHLVTRARGMESRKIEVLDVKPDEIDAKLQPLRKAGSYRLTVTIPADCPTVVFNGDHKRGYVQVGDPQDKNFSNWFPLYGAVVAVQDKTNTK